jgi:putative SOS response-associated peptidase YedK
MTAGQAPQYGLNVRCGQPSAAAPSNFTSPCATFTALGMPPPLRRGGPPVTNIRNTSSPRWRAWLKPENRCLVPFNSFAEYAPEPNPETRKKDVVWFAANEDRPLLSFAGIWTTNWLALSESFKRRLTLPLSDQRTN